MLSQLFLLLPLLAAPTEVAPKSTSEMAAPIHRGAAFTLKDSVSLDEVMKAPEKYNQSPVRIDGTVKSVCTKKGCWLILAGTEPTARARVTFKNYGFFAPMDCSGYRASVEGVVTAKVLGDAERAHLAEDGQVPVESVPKAEIRIVASGAAFQKP